MSLSSFTQIVHGMRFLPSLLRGKLLLLAPRMEGVVLEEIGIELRESQQREIDILKGAIAELGQIEKSLKRSVRQQKEEKDRQQEEQNLPDFDDAS